MAGNTPNNPTKAPNVPTGPKAKRKTSNSKVMKPMSKASPSKTGKGAPSNSRTVSPKSQSQTVQGGPNK